LNNRKEILKRKNRRLLWVLLLVVVLMFGFAYSLVPLYNLMCKVLGINGKTNPTALLAANKTDKTRSITIQFVAHTNSKLDWRFYPMTRSINIHPGENKKINYFAKNLTDHSITVQAIPSVTPGIAAKYLRKTECFCFTNQTLKAGQSFAMPIIFHIDIELPKNIHEITLSYTLYPVKKLKG